MTSPVLLLSFKQVKVIVITIIIITIVIIIITYYDIYISGIPFNNEQTTITLKK